MIEEKLEGFKQYLGLSEQPSTYWDTNHFGLYWANQQHQLMINQLTQDDKKFDDTELLVMKSVVLVEQILTILSLPKVDWRFIQRNLSDYQSLRDELKKSTKGQFMLAQHTKMIVIHCSQRLDGEINKFEVFPALKILQQFQKETVIRGWCNGDRC